MLSTDWSNGNTTLVDELWDGLAPNVGMVAVGVDMGTNVELYSTEPFPWDSSKGVYMLEGYHSIITSTASMLCGRMPSVSQTIPCGQLVAKNAGRRPHKQCRDWDQLERWALQNSACFKRFPDGHAKRKTLEDWRWCPEGSPYNAAIEMFFGRGE